MTDIGLLILRVGSGALMLFGHGIPKLMKFSSMWSTFPNPLGVGSAPSLVLAVFAEVVCALFLVVGFATRFSAVPLVITMLTAGLIVHANDPWPKPELALVYAVMYLALCFLGGGKFSVDFLVRTFRSRP